MQRCSSKLAIWLLALTVVMACSPAFSAAPVPTLDPGNINRIIAETAEAASTQTAAALPTSTPTETLTPTPRGTNTPEPTATETLILVYNTPTAFVILPAITKTVGPATKKDYLCKVLNSPTEGTIYSPRLEFKVRWRLQNIGLLKWEREGVDFVYDFGDRFHRTSSYDLDKTIEFGDVAELFVDMQAPKDPGTYTTHWALKVGTEKFCKVSLTIGVKE